MSRVNCTVSSVHWDNILLDSSMDSYLMEIQTKLNERLIRFKFTFSTYHVLGQFSNDRLKYNSPCGWREHKAEIKIKRIPSVQFVVDAHWIAKKFLPQQRAV